MSDISKMSGEFDEEMAKLKGVELLVINALHHHPHHSHMTIAQSLNVVRKVQPKEAIFIHMSHEIGLHAKADKQLPPHVHFAYDGLIVRI